MRIYWKSKVFFAGRIEILTVLPPTITQGEMAFTPTINSDHCRIDTSEIEEITTIKEASVLLFSHLLLSPLVEGALMITYCQKSKFNYRHGVDGSQTVAKFPILCNKVPILSSYMRMTHQLVGSLPFQPSQDSTLYPPKSEKKVGKCPFHHSPRNTSQTLHIIIPRYRQ